MRPLTRSCLLLLLLGRISFLSLPHLLETCLPSLWSPSFPLRALVLIPLSRQDAALAHLDSLPPYNLVLWTNGSVPFPFGKGGSGILANCSLCGTEATFFFSAGTVSSSFSAEACAILHALCWSRKHQQVCHFSSFSIRLSLCPRHPVISSTFPLTSISERSGRNCLFSPPVQLGYNGSSDTCFSRGTTRLMSWPDGEPYSRPLQFLVVSFLFSRTGGVLSHRNSSTHMFPRFPPRNLCSLVTLAVCSLVFAAPADTRPRTPLISFCTVQLQTHCAARFLATLCLSTTSGPCPGK